MYVYEALCQRLLFFGGVGGMGLTDCQDYFTHFERSRSVGGAKMGDPPREKLPDHLQAELV